MFRFDLFIFLQLLLYFLYLLGKFARLVKFRCRKNVFLSWSKQLLLVRLYFTLRSSLNLANSRFFLIFVVFLYRISYRNQQFTRIVEYILDGKLNFEILIKQISYIFIVLELTSHIMWVFELAAFGKIESLKNNAK